MQRPLTVAVTGGIGAGKSEALQAFARHGAATISADEIVHRLLAHDPEVQREIAAAYGVRIVRGTKEERAELANAVFGDESRLESLESLLHPRVIREQQAWLDRLSRSQPPPGLAVVEVPLLYETGGDVRFDAVVVITAPSEVRAARKRLERLAEREQRLLPDEEKVLRADFAYVNDGSIEELDAFVAGVVEELTRGA